MTQEEEYRIKCASMKPDERLKMCLELSEWSFKINKNIEFELNKRKTGLFVLE
jgi:hypothetical protein